LRLLPQGKHLPLIYDRSLVGRPTQAAPEVDLSDFGDHAGVSRRHAQITRSEGQVLIEDLGSSNGTFLNEVRLQPGLQHPLSHKDEIRFGSLRFQYWQKEV
jgi:pSer/pThr/pTyr-binding forkhead associated (FHA) protein